MAESTTSQQPTEANYPEKPAPAQVNNAPYNRYTLQPARFQPLDAPKAEPFRPSKSFSVGKLILGVANFIFAIIVLGLSIGVLTVELYDLVIIIIAAVMVSTTRRKRLLLPYCCIHTDLTFLVYYRLLLLSSGTLPISPPWPSDAPSFAPFILEPTWACT